MIDLEPFLKWRAAQSCESELPISFSDGYDNGIVENGGGGAEIGSPQLELGEGDGLVLLRESCARVAACLRETGALVIRHPCCSTEDNDRFLDMMERYFGQASDLKLKQERPELHYQVGVTPEGVEVPRCSVDLKLQEHMKSLPEHARPIIPAGPDRKWRYMWRIGPRPSTTRFQELNAEPVIPEGLPEWVDVMDGWGHKMIAAVEVVAEMVAIGFGLPKTAFTSLMKQGPHLLAPTGSDLSKYADLNNVFAGYHYDLNFLTIHGRSRFPGLFIWLKDGRKVPVKVPEGCLLLQAGKQLEWLTGGECAAGMHEVVVSASTLKAVEASQKAGKSLWRVSSTMFAHIASDALLKPLGHFATEAASNKYPPIYAGEYVEAELSTINLKNS